jgi:lipoprotein-anchoring transpeptidase ErfK/SrfK
MLHSGAFIVYWNKGASQVTAFGSAASHGCINLAPADAQWLHVWAGMGERVIIRAGK